MASNTAIPMVTALNTPSMLSWLSVRGSETRQQVTAVIALNATVQIAEPDNVFSNKAPTIQWRAEHRDSEKAKRLRDGYQTPCMKVLFRMNMTAVAYQAHVFPQKSI